MEIEVHARNLHVSPEELEHAKKRVLLALDRWEGRLSHVGVELTDENGKRGGVDKHVRIHARVDERTTLRAEDVDADLGTAIDKATTRLKTVVRHHLERTSREERRKSG
jgi:ribosomal subunit interface protein